MEGTVRVDLKDALAGHHVLVDPDEITMGLLEDIQSGKASLLLEALANAIKGGDLPHGTDRDGLRRLKLLQCAALSTGIVGLTDVPKAS